MDSFFDYYDGSNEAWADPAEQEDWVDTDLFYESISDSAALISLGSSGPVYVKVSRITGGTDEDYGYYGE